MELKPETSFHGQPGQKLITFPKFPMSKIQSVNQPKPEAWVTIWLIFLNIDMSIHILIKDAI